MTAEDSLGKAAGNNQNITTVSPTGSGVLSKDSTFIKTTLENDYSGVFGWSTFLPANSNFTGYYNLNCPGKHDSGNCFNINNTSYRCDTGNNSGYNSTDGFTGDSPATWGTSGMSYVLNMFSVDGSGSGCCGCSPVGATGPSGPSGPLAPLAPLDPRQVVRLESQTRSLLERCMGISISVIKCTKEQESIFLARATLIHLTTRTCILKTALIVITLGQIVYLRMVVLILFYNTMRASVSRLYSGKCLQKVALMALWEPRLVMALLTIVGITVSLLPNQPETTFLALAP